MSELNLSFDLPLFLCMSEIQIDVRYSLERLPDRCVGEDYGAHGAVNPNTKSFSLRVSFDPSSPLPDLLLLSCVSLCNAVTETCSGYLAIFFRFLCPSQLFTSTVASYYFIFLSSIF